MNKEKYPFPAFASMVMPGLGQLLKKNYEYAIIYFLAYWFSVALMFVLIGFIIAPVVYISGIYDAYTRQANN